MSDQDRNREREHWQAIAEQLGLAPEPESGPAAANVTPGAPQQQRPPSMRETRKAATANVGPVAPQQQRPPSMRETRQAATAFEPPAPELKEPERPPAAPERPQEMPQIPPGQEEREASDAALAETEEPRKPRRSRSRRSGKRREGPRAAESSAATGPLEEPAETQTPTGAEPTRDEVGEKPERRGRGRGRGRGQGRKSKESKVVGAEAAPAGEPTAPADESDSDAEELRSLSNWDVPSWTELIASLYRPAEPSRREERHGRRDY